MTLEESKQIKRMFPTLKQDLLNRHTNPPIHGRENPMGVLGGWVHKNATADPTASIHPTAFVLDRACVYDFALIGENTIVKGDAVVEDYAQIEDTLVSDFASVSNNSMILGSVLKDYAVVNGDSLLDNVQVTGYTVLTKRELTQGKLHTRLDQCGLGWVMPDEDGFNGLQPEYIAGLG